MRSEVLSDKVGNLFDDPERKLRKYLQGGKLEQSGEWHFEYDKDGQLTEKYKGSGKWWDTKRERWRYEWNQNGTLKAVKSPHRSNWVEFTYDALGRRLSKLASEYTHWVWNGNVPLHEWNSSREWKGDGWKHYELDLRTWVFEEESFVPMALLLNGKAYSIVTDQLGTPTEAYNAEGEEVWRRRLDMNGKILEEYNRNAPYSEQIRIPFLFQGQYYDHETELAYNRFRYYSPELGRYISENPIRFASGILSLYSYVEDTNQIIDPLGLIHLNKLTAKANFKRYIIYEDETKKKVLKFGKAKSDDVMADGKKQRMHNSERQAKKQYPNAFAEEYRDLGYTSTRKAIGAEAKEVRTRRNKGEELPLNREKKKSYHKNS